MDIDPEKLISLVEVRPALYDTKLKSYNDRKIKEQLWQEICEDLIIGWTELTTNERTQIGTKIQKRWQNLRTCFKKEYNNQRDERSGHSAKKRKKYEYFDQLQFLLPTIKDRTTLGNNTLTQKIKVEQVTNSPSETASNGSISPTAHMNTKPKMMKQVKHFVEENPVHVAADSSKNEEFVDEDRHFMLSLVPSLQRMTNSQKLKVKMKFLQAISDIEDEALQQSIPVNTTKSRKRKY